MEYTEVSPDSVIRLDQETETELWLRAGVLVSLLWGVFTLLPSRKPGADFLPAGWHLPVAVGWFVLGLTLVGVVRRLDDQLDVDPLRRELRTVRLFGAHQRTLSAVPFESITAVARRRTAPARGTRGGDLTAGVTLLTHDGKTLHLLHPGREAELAQQISALLGAELVDTPGLLTDRPVRRNGTWHFGQLASAAATDPDDELPRRLS